MNDGPAATDTVLNYWLFCPLTLCMDTASIYISCYKVPSQYTIRYIKTIIINYPGKTRITAI